MAASSAEQDLEFARGYIEDLPEIGGNLARAVGLTREALEHPAELQRVALALADVQSAISSLNQSMSEARISKLLKQKSP